MTTGARALGRLINVSVGAVPTDAVAGAITGNRVHLKDAGGVTFIVVASAGSTDILDLDLQEHNAASGGTSQDLDIITKAYYQDEATLDGDETWVEWSQSAASEITNIGSASAQQLVVVEVGASQLSDGFEWVSLNVPDLGTNGSKYVTILNVVHDLHVMRKPTNLANLNT
ncbi:hypothetical protein ABZ307_28415 [Streptomyces griseorubiginosus]|uniref:hypothetical protein n=1 Tax=Streptomyces griseorubiginosus TaxID=67304 RepID=UPI0033AAF799